MALKYHHKIFDFLGKQPFLETKGKTANTLKRVEEKYQIPLSPPIREWYLIKNSKLIITPYVKWLISAKELGQFTYKTCFEHRIPKDETIQYFYQLYQSRQLLHLFRIGDDDVFLHLQAEQPEPVVYLGRYSVYNSNFIWHQSPHPFSTFLFLTVWDTVVAGRTKPKKFRKGWRFEMRGKQFSGKNHELFAQRFTAFPPTLGRRYGRDFHRFHKGDQQLIWIFDDVETSYYYFYAHEEADLVELLRFIQTLKGINTIPLFFRRGHRGKEGADHVCDRIWGLVRKILG